MPKDTRKEFKTPSCTYVANVEEDVLGKGTYGTVYRVRSTTDSRVIKAIKTFAPETVDENEGIPSTTLREINAMKTMRHPNVMRVEDVVIPADGSITDMFIIMQLCKGTLKDKAQDMIKKHLHTHPRWLNPTEDMQLPVEYLREAKLIVWQALNALAACHSRAVMHRDLKPANMLWGDDDLIKLGDFGLARFVRGNSNIDDSVIPQTGEVQTMWYRAPEVLLGDEKYGMLVDDWSVGCVMAELFRFRMSASTGRMETDPLFPGRGDVHTLLLIFETLGTPFDQAYLSSLEYWSDDFPKWKTGNVRKRIPLLDPVGVDLLLNLLAVSPSERKAARFLLNHPWFDDVKVQIKHKLIPWYSGMEESYYRLKAIDALPPAQPLKQLETKTKNTDQKENDENANDQNVTQRSKKDSQGSGGGENMGSSRSRSPDRSDARRKRADNGRYTKATATTTTTAGKAVSRVSRARSRNAP
eukprot:GHVO01065363.1.p1 GENE.GHVO01065363.1~~GHVO01065363.1.p1  ORF type:complete len:470 (-),score=71.53 GHVO01065363.1:229-1638(-)